MKHLIFNIFILISTALSAQNGLRSTQELSLNGFRNPSIGLEYRYHLISIHAGFYPTNFESGITTTFIRSGATLWLLPVGKKAIPSSFYVSASYLRGLSRDYKNEDALISELGFRWMIWKGLHLRIGAAMLAADGHAPKFNPTPGIGYAFILSSDKN